MQICKFTLSSFLIYKLTFTVKGCIDRDAVPSH